MRKSLVAAVLTASTLLLASCAMPADDPNFDPNAGVNNEENAALASAAAADVVAMEDAMLPPTTLGVDSPLPAAPAEGAVIVEPDRWHRVRGRLRDGARRGGGRPRLDGRERGRRFSGSDRCRHRLRRGRRGSGPAGIHFTGGFFDALSASLPAAETAGIPVICTGCSGEPGGGISDASINGTEQNIAWGAVLGSYVLANQYEGEDAGAQVFALPGGAMTDFNLQLSTTIIDQCRELLGHRVLRRPDVPRPTDPASVSSFVVGEMSTALGSWAVLDSGALSSGVADALATDPTLLAPVVLIGSRGLRCRHRVAPVARGRRAPAGEASARRRRGVPSRRQRPRATSLPRVRRPPRSDAPRRRRPPCRPGSRSRSP